MRALWLENQKLRFRADVPKPELRPNFALIRVLAAGICATDLEMVRGYYAFSGVPGHEFVGRVEAASGEPGWIGSRVVGEINIACGSCKSCLRGHRTHCERRKVLGLKDWNGVFAEYALLPLANLHPVPDFVPNDAAVFAEPLAAALEILTQVDIGAGDRVLVVGAGRLGQLIAQVLATTGCGLQVVARHDSQKAILAARQIATISEDQAPRREIDLVVEATGSPGGFALARQAVRPRGTIVLKSTYAGDMRVDFSSLVVDEITLIGSRCGPFEPALKLLLENRVDPTPLITARYPLSDGLRAFECAALPGVFKVLIEMGD